MCFFCFCVYISCKLVWILGLIEGDWKGSVGYINFFGDWGIWNVGSGKLKEGVMGGVLSSSEEGVTGIGKIQEKICEDLGGAFVLWSSS